MASGLPGVQPSDSKFFLDFPIFGRGRWPREQTTDTGRVFLFPPRPSGLGPLAGGQCHVAIAVKSSSSRAVGVSVDTAGAHGVGWILAVQVASGLFSDTVLPEVGSQGPGAAELGRGAGPNQRGWECEPRASSGRGALGPVCGGHGGGSLLEFSTPRPVGADKAASCVSAGVALPFFMIYILSLRRRSRREPPLSPTKPKGNPAEADTLNLICASHLFARCGNMTTGGGGGGGGSVFTRAAALDPWPTHPSSACVLTLPGDPGCRGPQGAPAFEPLLMDKQLPSRPASGRDKAGAG